MRAFIARGELGDDGDLVARVKETEGRLKTRYACSRFAGRMSIRVSLFFFFVEMQKEQPERGYFYPITTMWLALGFGSGMLLSLLCLGVCRI